MGCDIHSYAERKNADNKWEPVENLHPFSVRGYVVFAFLAGVRNYSALTPISEARGFPVDASAAVAAAFDDYGCDAHSPSWLSVAELLEFDYDAVCEDRRGMRRTGPTSWDGGCTADAGEGKKQPYREFLGDNFFDDLKKLQDAGAGRVVFWFDN